jgi:multidrug transporter EmrE-like cation transporter
MLIVLGIPLEGFHGTGLVALMHTIGVVGGGLAWMLLDPYRMAYGSSGGCFSLLGMHIAHLILNWRHSKFRILTVFFVLCVIAVDLGGYAISSIRSSTAYAVHGGGVVFGLLIGFPLTRTIDKSAWRWAVRALSVVLLVVIAVFSLWWWWRMPFPAIRSLLLPDEEPLCWIGQMIPENTVCDSNYSRQCARCTVCGTRRCVEHWYARSGDACVTRGGAHICGSKFSFNTDP